MAQLWLLLASLVYCSVGGALGCNPTGNQVSEGFDNQKIENSPRLLFDNFTLPEDEASMKKCGSVEGAVRCAKVHINFSVFSQDKIALTDEEDMFIRTKVEESLDGTNKTFHYVHTDGEMEAILSLTTSSGYPQLHGYMVDVPKHNGTMHGIVIRIMSCGQDCHVFLSENVSFHLILRKEIVVLIS